MACAERSDATGTDAGPCWRRLSRLLELTAGLLAGLLLLSGFTLWHLFRRRRECFLQSRVVATTGCSVVVTDATVPRHPVLYANPAFRLLTGYAGDEVIGQSLAFLNGPQTDRAAIEKLALALQDGRACRVVVRHYRKDGTPFWNEITLSPVKNRRGRVTEHIWVMSDVTQRQQAEQTIRDDQERLDLIVETAHVGIFEHDHRTDRLYWSPTLRAIYGVGDEEPGSLQRYIELIPHEDRAAVLQALRTAHDPAGDGRLRIEHRLTRPDGGARYVRVRSETRFEGAGPARAPVHTIGVVVDITDHKLAETHLRNASKMEAIGTLAGGIAHEFNNSLTAVLGFSELALPLIPVESKAYRHIQQVIAAGRKSRELVHQLLTFSRQSDQIHRPLSLSSLVKELLKLLRPTIPSWVEVRERIARSTRPIMADTAQMHQLVLHLVEHALHAMRQTGGVLDIELLDRDFTADLVTPAGRIPAGSYACLTVRDSGEGMEPEVASRVFDPFFTTKSTGETRGMGLSAVHEIVTSHGGTVLVESRPSAGTAVSVYLPAPPPPTPPASEQDSPLPRGHECVLFVDDEESLARFGGEMLESLGYYSVVRMSATQAWEAFQLAPQRFDLLITDQIMPGMSGDALARECRRLRPDLPIILCTGSGQNRSKRDTGAFNVTEYLVKPLMLHELAHTIRRVLDARQAFSAQADRPAPVSVVAIEEPDAVSARR